MSVNESISPRPETAGVPLGRGDALLLADRRVLAGTVALVLTGIITALLAGAAAGTDVILPETLRPVPPAFLSLVGPLGGVGRLGSGVQAVHGIGGLALGNWAVMGLLGALFACYVVAVRCAERLSPRLVIGTAAFCTAVMLLAPPIISTDIFSYQGYARMLTLYGANPYLSGPHAIGLDPVYSFIGAKWWATPSVYGPLFTLVSGLFAGPEHISLAGIATSAYAYKTIGALSVLATIVLLWRGARIRGVSGTRAITLFALNPLVTFYAIGGGHNDLLTVALSTAGLYAVLGRRERSAGALVAAATMIKLTAGLLLPFALVARQPLPVPGRHRRLLVGAGVTGGVILAAGFAVFGTGLLHLPFTLDKVQSAGGGTTLPEFISQVLRVGWLGQIVGLLQGAAFIGVCAWLLRRVHRGQMDWVNGAAWATFALLVSSSALLPWYVSWLLPVVALCTDRRLWNVSLWFTGWVLLTTVVAYIPNGATILGV